MRHLTWPAKTEPSLHEVLSDPIVRQMMTCDKVQDDDLIDLIESVRHNLAVHVWRGSEPASGEAPLHAMAKRTRHPRRWKRLSA